jgi:membrane protein
MRPSASPSSQDNADKAPHAPATESRDRNPLHAAWWRAVFAWFQRLFARAIRTPLGASIHRYVTIAQGLDLAAGIAFRLLTYLLPLLGTVLATLGLVLRDPEHLEQITNAIISLMPAGIGQALTSSLTATRDSAGWLAVISLVTLFWIGSSLLDSLARAFNGLYQAPRRAAIAGRALTLGLLILIPLLFIATVLVSSIATSMANLVASRIDTQMQLALSVGTWTQIVALATSWLLAFVLALTLFWGLPNVTQGFGDVWPGAALAAALIVATNQLFPLYVGIAFGNQGSAILFLLAVTTTWAYLLANVLLIGVSVNALRHARRHPSHAGA